MSHLLVARRHLGSAVQPRHGVDHLTRSRFRDLVVIRQKALAYRASGCLLQPYVSRRPAQGPIWGATMATLLGQTLALTLISLGAGQLLAYCLLPSLQRHTLPADTALQLDGQDWRASRIVKRGSGHADATSSLAASHRPQDTNSARV